MGRFDIKKEDDNENIEILLCDLFIALSVLTTTDSVRLFIADLLGVQEMTMLARRMRIAVMLMLGCSSRKIVRDLDTSSATIARISRRLEMGGEGLGFVVDNFTKSSIEVNEQELLKTASHEFIRWVKSHPLYFWPTEIAIETIKKLNEPLNRNNKKVKKLFDGG